MLLQLLCIFSMMLDHIGYLFNNDILRAVGRVSMPIYAYFVAVGWHNTAGQKRYMRRIMSIAFISQIPYIATFGSRFNICFVWFAAVCILNTVHKDDGIKKIVKLTSIIMICAIIPCDYGIIAIIWVLVWERLIYNGDSFTSIILLAIAVFLSVLQHDAIQIISLAALPIVFMFHFANKVYMNKKYKYIWRAFYPVHLFILGALKGVIRCPQ